MLKQVLAVLAIFGAAQLVAVSTDTTKKVEDAAAPVVNTDPTTEVKKEEVVAPAATPVVNTDPTTEVKKEETK